MVTIVEFLVCLSAEKNVCVESVAQMIVSSGYASSDATLSLEVAKDVPAESASEAITGIVDTAVRSYIVRCESTEFTAARKDIYSALSEIRVHGTV
eukprot:12078587-Heterocapsa_arctica.AAC.1